MKLYTVPNERTFPHAREDAIVHVKVAATDAGGCDLDKGVARVGNERHAAVLIHTDIFCPVLHATAYVTHPPYATMPPVHNQSCQATDIKLLHMSVYLPGKSRGARLQKA